MLSEYTLQQMPLSLSEVRKKVATLMQRCSLDMPQLDYYVGVFTSDGRLVGGAGLHRNVIKGVAVEAEARSDGLTSSLISYLLTEARSRGYENVMVFTKPENRKIFEALSFCHVAETDEAVLLESNPNSLRHFKASLRGAVSQTDEKGSVGVAVMNYNPLTRGHEYLIKQAAKKVDTMVVVLVSEDVSEFTLAERRAMLQQCVAAYENVRIVESGCYAISAATFPSYFLKEPSSAAQVQMRLDLDLFCRHIAPSLQASVRFVGSEKSDELTAQYNIMMRQVLQQAGVKVVEIPRLTLDGQAVSASAVRKFLTDGTVARAFSLVPPCTLPHLIAHAAKWALQAELDLTPKPGLVDQHDNGAHSDMDYRLMKRSIDALFPAFSELACCAYSGTLLSTEKLREMGLKAEHAMFEATHGVNTHRGALFSLGLAVVGSSHLLFCEHKVSEKSLSEVIGRLTRAIEAPRDTHGANVVKKHAVGGALYNAQTGYRMLFDHWLPAYRTHHSPLRLLLEIISELDDTNVWHRCGKDIALKTRAEAKELLHLPNEQLEEALARLNQQWTSARVSPGGAADMLALTLFIDSLTL